MYKEGASRTCGGGGEVHLRPGLVIVGVEDGTVEELVDDIERVLGPHVRDGVAALVGRPQNRVSGTGPSLRVVDRRVGLQGVAEHVETGEGAEVRFVTYEVA